MARNSQEPLKCKQTIKFAFGHGIVQCYLQMNAITIYPYPVSLSLSSPCCCGAKGWHSDCSMQLGGLPFIGIRVLKINSFWVQYTERYQEMSQISRFGITCQWKQPGPRCNSIPGRRILAGHSHFVTSTRMIRGLLFLFYFQALLWIVWMERVAGDPMKIQRK